MFHNENFMELVGNLVHADAGIVSSAAPSVAIEYSDQSRRRDVPAYASNDGARYNRSPGCSDSDGAMMEP